MKTHSLLVLAAIASSSMVTNSMAQEQGRVISTTPVITQVAVPRQVCSNEQVITQAQQKSGGGAALGGVVGGVIGNAAGKGNGRAAMTMLGIVGGAILGDHVEGNNVQQTNSQSVQRCTTQTFYENRPTAYNVVYEFNGKQYQVQLPQDPGSFVSLQVTPVGGAPVAPVQPASVIVRPVTQAPIYTQPIVVAAPVYTQPVYTQPVVIESYTTYVQPVPVYVRPAPVYVAAPVYYGRPYHHHGYPQPYPYRPYGHGTNISIGYSGHFR